MSDAESSHNQPLRKSPGRPFQKGVSGNPGGRPAVIKDIQALARAHTEAAIQALVKALENPRERVAAAMALLDRGYGRPSQRTELTGADGGPIQTQTVEDVRAPLETFLEEFRAKREETKH